MQAIANGKRQWKKICGLCFCIGIIFLGTVFCGRGIPPDYNQLFNTSTENCQGQSAVSSGELALALALSSGPNITICVLRASDGILLRHYDLEVHGDMVGHGAGQLYLNERDGKTGTSRALCSVDINSGITRWCQTDVTNTVSVTIANGKIYALATESTSGRSMLIALNERDGLVLWHNPARQDLAPSDIKLVPGRDAIYTDAYSSSANPGSTSTPGATSSFPQQVCALLPASGQLIWCKEIPAIFDMFTNEDRLYVLDANPTPQLETFAANGSLVDSVPLPEIDASPATQSRFFMVRNIIFINVGYTNEEFLFALRPGDQKPLWSKRNSLSPLSSIQVWNNYLYTIDAQGKVEALNVLNGEPAWSYAGLSQGGIVVPPRLPTNTFLSKESMLYLLDGTDAFSYLLALNANTGAPLWKDSGCYKPLTPAVSATPMFGTPLAVSQRCYWKDNNYVWGYNSYQKLQISPVQLLQFTD